MQTERSNDLSASIRYVTNIEQESLDIKIHLDAGFEIRHMKNLPDLSFAITNKETGATIQRQQGGRTITTFFEVPIWEPGRRKRR
jgi:hypothetical protein